MSKWSEIRQNINDKILNYFRILSLTPEVPDPQAGPYPPNTAVIYPATDMELVKKASSVELSVNLQYDIQYWISKVNIYNQLPLIDLEALLVSGVVHMISTGVEGVIGMSCQSSGIVVERGQNNIEWNCKISLLFSITCFVDEESVPLLQDDPAIPGPILLNTIEQHVQ